MKEAYYWLASPDFLIYLSHTAQAYLPKDGTTHNSLGPPASISNQENASQTCSQASLTEATPPLPLRLPIPLGCVKLTS